jgi:hypothetical protein
VAKLPEGVVGGVRAAAGGDEVDVAAVEADAKGDVAGLGEKVGLACGER